MDTTPAKPRLREQLCNAIRVNHYSIRAKKACWCWRRYYRCDRRVRHPLETGPAEISEFVTWLGEIGDTVCVERPACILTVLAHTEAQRIIAPQPEPHRRPASLKYGAGLRVKAVRRAVRTAHTLLGHADVRTTQIDNHVLGNAFAEVQSSLGCALAGYAELSVFCSKTIPGRKSLSIPPDTTTWPRLEANVALMFCWCPLTRL